MMDSGTTVSAELGLMLVVPQHTTVPLVASLFYSGDDPYAVRMAFHVGTDEPVEWIFARDLLAAGMAEPAGEGDVRAWPSSSSGDGGDDGAAEDRDRDWRREMDAGDTERDRRNRERHGYAHLHRCPQSALLAGSPGPGPETAPD